jgi:hypothetical protein
VVPVMGMREARESEREDPNARSGVQWSNLGLRQGGITT